jgi:hypothetical protein
VTAAVAALVGLLGSVYASEIAKSFPLTPIGPYEGFSWRAVIFWVSLFALALLVYLRQNVDDEARGALTRTTEAAERTSRRIEDFVQTLPPRAFQAKLAQAVTVVNNAVGSALPRSTTATRDDLVGVIRGVLHSVASLALIYDDPPPVGGRSARYSANIMLFEASDVDPDQPLEFFPAEYDRRQLAGILRLRVDLSATSEVSDSPPPDVATPSIRLPVPAMAKRDGRWLTLPGAPYAYLSDETAGYENTASLAEWVETKGNFPPSVAAQLRDYFSAGPGGQIKSFISTPLVTARKRKIGVLNIHADRPSLLARIEKQQTFQALLTPVLHDLGDTVEALIELEDGLRNESRAGNIRAEERS